MCEKQANTFWQYSNERLVVSLSRPKGTKTHVLLFTFAFAQDEIITKYNCFASAPPFCLPSEGQEQVILILLTFSFIKTSAYANLNFGIIYSFGTVDNKCLE